MENQVLEEAVEIPLEVMARLEGELLEKWEKTKNDQVFDEIEQFGQQLEQLGQDYAIPHLQKFGETLKTQAESFEIETMNTTLETYPELIEQLK